MRADQLLLERGLAVSRSQAQRLIASGVRWRAGGDWRTVAKNGEELPAQAELELADDAEARFVSRGGLKLEGALALAGLDVRGWRCLDVGQSTGGFTDCLLAHGAARVVGVDVGHGQLHPRLRGDARVHSVEHLNARALTPASLQAAGLAPGDSQGFDLVVADLSFISLTHVLPMWPALTAPHGHWLALVKPQFELQPSDIGKGGLVKDAGLHAQVERRLRDALDALGWPVQGWWPSPITGGDGNQEFFVLAARRAAPQVG